MRARGARWVGRKAQDLLAEEDSELAYWAASPKPVGLTAKGFRLLTLLESRQR